MPKITTADEARALFLVTDADTVEAAANKHMGLRCGVDAEGNIWTNEHTVIAGWQLVEIANSISEAA